MEKTFTISSAAAADPNAKKLYRACVECVKSLDQGMKGKMTPHSLANLMPTRKRLRDCCEKLIFLNPLEFGRKADEILWRKCHYEPIKCLRQNSEVLCTESKCMLNSMLTSAMGYYEMFLLKLQHEFAPNGKNGEFWIFKNHTKPECDKENLEKSKQLREWCMDQCHRILIYQGDLARYVHETDEYVDHHMAQHYYYRALALKPNHGTPHNQLGTLMLSSNYGLDAAYHYLRSISSEENFGGANENFLSLLSKNELSLEQFLSKIGTDDKEVLSDSFESGFKYFVMVFMASSRLLFLDEAEKNDGVAIQSSCGRTIRAFCTALRLAIKEKDASAIGSLDYDSLLEVFVIQMLLIAKLQAKGSLKLSPAIALFLSMFSNFLNVIVDDFCNDLALQNGNTERAEENLLKSVETSNSGPIVVARKSIVTKLASKKPNFLKRRKDEEDDEADGDESNEIYERSLVESEGESNEGTGLAPTMSKSTSTSDSDDIIELSEDEELGIANLVKANGKEKCNSNHDLLLHASKSEDNDKRKPWLELTPSEKVDILARYGFLIPLKVISDWCRCNSNLLQMVHQNSGELWSSLSRILNFLPDDRELADILQHDSHLSREFEDTPILSLTEWIQKYPLPEDIMLRGCGPLKPIHSGLDFKRVISAGLQSEAITRICCLRSFGYYLIHLGIPSFQFDRARLEFIASNGKVILQDSTESDKKHALMRSMAQLRLKDEIAAAEKVAWIPVYLVPDATALCMKIALIKKLASAQKFITVIPTATINELDRMKKDNGPARFATRWLESQFRRGNKFVRIQKSTESDDSLSLENGAVADGLPGNILEMLKCAGKLRNSVKAGTTGGSTIVTILTNYAVKSPEYEKINNVVQATNVSGITVANISTFCKLWDSYKREK